MRKILCLAMLLALGLPAKGDTAFGTLNNFDCVNDTGQKCYGFLIEMEDVSSTDITYTYDWNHYGPPRIGDDKSDPARPRTFVYYESKKNPDGTFASFTNPLDPAHPIGSTSGHDCTNPSVNFGCEHFGIGLYRAPSRVRYNWLVEDPAKPGTLMVGPMVTIAAPIFTYVPPPAPAAPARVQAVIEPPEPPEPEPGQWGVPVWVKILKTVQPSGKYLKLDELVTDDETDSDDVNWDGDEEAETEIEWTVFQKRPPEDEVEDQLEAEDELPEGDEMVTRRYEFYVYEGPVNPEDGEAQCDNPDNCPDAVGQYIGSQMAGFNVEAPLGLIDHLQDGDIAAPYVDRRVVVGGNTPYEVEIVGDLPQGLGLDPETGILSGTPLEAGAFFFKVTATDKDDVSVSKEYSLNILIPLAITTDALPSGQENADYLVTLTAAGGVPDYTWSVDAVPSGLVFGADGVLSGKPDVGTAGEYLLTFSITDDSGTTVSKSLSLMIAAAPLKPGDINGDGAINQTDLWLILIARNKPASGPDDPRDLDRDGRITVLDARILVTLYDKPTGSASTLQTQKTGMTNR